MLSGSELITIKTGYRLRIHREIENLIADLHKTDELVTFK